jgi:hypothetical protein
VSWLVSHSDEEQDVQTTVKPSPRIVSLVFFARDRGMVFFLAFLVVATILVQMITLSLLGRFALALVFVLTIISGACATVQHRLVKYIVIVLAIVSLVVELIAERSFGHRVLALDSTLKLVCLAILVFMTLKRTLRPGPVTVYRVTGGIAGYLLIGMTWAFAYQLSVQQAPEAIRFESPLAHTAPRQLNDLMYFSFVTLTTVGYGDVTPVHPVVRSLAVAEALVGQLYLAILIASLVGMAIQGKPTEIRDHAFQQIRVEDAPQ